MTLTAQSLTLQRGHRLLVQDFTLTLNSGDGVTIRGPNGSGKTTLLRALADLHQPKIGKVSNPDGSDEDAPQISLLGHVDPIKAGEKLRDLLAFWARLSGKPISIVSEIVAQTGLSKQLDLQGGALSAGQRRRASLARLLIEDRAIWLLDEPAAPLDEDGRALLGRLLDQHRAKGGMFVAAVHDGLPGEPTRDIWLSQS